MKSINALLKRFQLALAVVLASLAFTGQAQASDYGCRALLCFAGGQGLAECAATISQVLAGLRHMPPIPFPTCDMADGNSAAGSNYAQVTMRPPYADCPQGSTPAPTDYPIRIPTNDYDGDYSLFRSEYTDAENGNAGQRMCVTGGLTFTDGGADNPSYYSLNAGSTYTLLDQQYGQEIDVYVNNGLFTRVPF